MMTSLSFNQRASTAAACADMSRENRQSWLYLPGSQLAFGPIKAHIET
jgi:hypothetical protein